MALTCSQSMRLALKTQSQCRATVETLAALKNPPLVFAKQANIQFEPLYVNPFSDTWPVSSAASNVAM